MSDFNPATSALTNAVNANTALLTQQAKQKASTLDIEKAEETAHEFEALFIAEMLKPMFEGIETDGMFGGGKGEEVFRGMMLDEYGKMIAQTSSIGLADQVKEQMILLQEQANNGA